MKGGRVSGDVLPHRRTKSTFTHMGDPVEFRMAHEERKAWTEALSGKGEGERCLLCTYEAQDRHLLIYKDG